MPVLPRRPVLMLLLWLALASMPLRGLAQGLMHLPQAATAAADCHGQHGDAATGDADAQAACALCDLCHGAVVPGMALPSGVDYRAPRVAMVPVLAGLAAAPRLERPPRA